MKKFPTYILWVSFSLLIILIFTFSSQKSTDDSTYRSAFYKNYKIFSPEIPDTLNFAGEEVPLDVYYVRESLDKELIVNTYWHSNTILMFKRAFRWAPVILPILEKNGIPEDFFFLCMIESGLDNVVSPAGAAGFWQIMKATGQSYGLEINSEVDERYHVEKSTETACKYLNTAYARFKSWTLAAASYNMGMEGLNNQLVIQKTNNYYDLQLNKETLRYVYRILAVKTIFKNPVKYGFYLRPVDFFMPVKVYSVTVDTSVPNLADFAVNNKVSYRALKDLNPWLLGNTLTNKSRKKYNIYFPADGNIYHSTLKKEFENENALFNDTLRVDQIQ